MELKDKTIILMIHGFTGSEADDQYLYKNLVKSGYEVHNFRLKGHEGKFISNVTADEWYEQAEGELKKLIEKGYGEIILYGHSMGGNSCRASESIFR